MIAADCALCRLSIATLQPWGPGDEDGFGGLIQAEKGGVCVCLYAYEYEYDANNNNNNNNSGCETWSVTFRVERNLRVFENRVLRHIFGAKKDEVTGEWRRLHNEELYGLYCPPNIIRVNRSRSTRWAGHVARFGDRRGGYRVFGVET